MLKAQVARFYGWNDKDISDMKMDDLMDYYSAITPLKAIESNDLLQVIAYPHKNSTKQQEYSRALHKSLRPYLKKNSIEDLGQIIGGL